MIQMGADWHQGRVSLWKYSYYVSVTGDLAVSPFKFVVSEELDSMLAKENEYIGLCAFRTIFTFVFYVLH